MYQSKVRPMPLQQYAIADIARSEMSRKALNAWKQFRLPPSDDRIETLMKKLGAARHSDQASDCARTIRATGTR